MSRVARKISLNLTTRSEAALGLLQDLTDLTLTDAVNRAVQFYSYVEVTRSSGGKVFIQEAGDAGMQEVKFL